MRHGLRHFGHQSLAKAAAGLAIAASLLVAPAVALSSTQTAGASGVPFVKGDVLASIGNGQIGHFSATGTLLDTLNTTTGFGTAGMCFDASGNVFSTDFLGASLSKFDSSGNLLAANFGSGFNGDPESCVVDKSGNIYVGQAYGSHQILKFDANGNLLAAYSADSAGVGTDWIDLSADQCTMHYTGETSLIKAFNVCTNTQLPDFASGLPGICTGHRILSDGGELVACFSVVVRLNASGSVVQTYNPAGGTGGDYFALNIDPDGTSFWTGNINTGQIWRIDISTGTVITTFTAGLNAGAQLGGLAVVGEINQGGGLGSGAFVIGSGVATVGSTVNFWGSQWQMNNPLGTGTAPDSFKGFALSPAVPMCGAQFTSTTGDSPSPPLGPLPAVMPVIVTDSVQQVGHKIVGNIAHIMMVSTNPGYGPDPGSPGTGTVVSVAC
jgi:hypothetical protein